MTMKNLSKGTSTYTIGFTLIEIVVAIAVLAMMSAAVLSLINPVREIKRGNDSRRKADLTKIQSALELYRYDNSNYPTSPSPGLSALTGSTPKYLETIPSDPVSGNPAYVYTASPSGCNNSTNPCLGYTLYACLENTSDPQRDDVDEGANDKCKPRTGLVSYTVRNP
jgi:prepilin-type N-terminal cleavage/methylation domain-containing protein